MPIFSLITVSLILVFLELSVLPFFKIAGATPFLVVPFLVILAIKYKGYFHILLTLFFGLALDFATVGFFGRFTIIFLVSLIVGRIFFFRQSSYNTGQSFFTLTALVTVTLYASQIGILYKYHFEDWRAFVTISVSGLILTLLVSLIFYRYLCRYVDWLNKKHSESFKG